MNEPGDPADKLEPVVLLGQQWCTKVTDMVVPIDQDVNVKEDNDLVDRSGPEETHGVNKPPAFLTLKMDWMEKAALREIQVNETKRVSDQTRQPQKVRPTGRSGQKRGETPPITRGSPM